MDGRNAMGETYQDNALMKCVDTLRDKNAKEFVKYLMADHKKFVGKDHFFDDLTIVAVKISPQKKKTP